jgi:hypothetical protein
MRPLVVIYSVTGNTRLVGQLLAKDLEAPIVEITCPRYEGGLLAHLRQAWDIFTGATPPISLPPAVDLEHIDLLVVGGPVWAGRPAPPLRSFLQRTGHEIRTVLFLTCSGTSKRYPGEKALDELARASAPVAKDLFKEVEIAADEIRAQVAAFARRIRAVSQRIEHAHAHDEPSPGTARMRG